MFVVSLIFFLVGFAGGVYAEKIYSVLRIGAATTCCRKNLKNLMSRGYRELCYVDNWGPQHYEFRKFKNLEDPDDAWSREGCFRETSNGCFARYGRPDKRKTLRVWILFMHTISWTVSETEEEGGEEEQREQDTPMDVEPSTLSGGDDGGEPISPSVVCGRRFTSSGFSAIRRAPACGRCL